MTNNAVKSITLSMVGGRELESPTSTMSTYSCKKPYCVKTFIFQWLRLNISEHNSHSSIINNNKTTTLSGCYAVVSDISNGRFGRGL